MSPYLELRKGETWWDSCRLRGGVSPVPSGERGAVMLRWESGRAGTCPWQPLLPPWNCVLGSALQKLTEISVFVKGEQPNSGPRVWGSMLPKRRWRACLLKSIRIWSSLLPRTFWASVSKTISCLSKFDFHSFLDHHLDLTWELIPFILQFYFYLCTIN